MEPMEALAAGWIAEHPEYFDDFADENRAVAARYDEAGGRGNPFLHVAMHLSISEQCSIDQPQGIRRAVELLTQRCGDLHAAHHAVMDDLARMLDEAQRGGRPPDGAAYVERVMRRATRD